MEIIFFILPICVVIAAAFVGGFVWMTKNGQYDDLETPANRILLDDKRIITNSSINNNQSINDYNKERK
jgi:cbb3-type cytochrome oxidase maturation protein